MKSSYIKSIFDIVADEIYKLDLVKMALLPVINKMFSLERAQQPTIFFSMCISARDCSDYSCEQYVPKYKKCVNNCLLGLGQSSHTCLIDTTEL